MSGTVAVTGHRPQKEIKTRKIVGIGDAIDYMDIRWQVQTITKQYVVLVQVGNPSRTTRVDLSVFESLV